MSAIFRIDQPAGAGSGVDGEARRDLWRAVQILLTAVNVAPDGYLWEFEPGGIPPGSTAVINNPTLQTANFTPDLAGSYRVRLSWFGPGAGRVSTKVIRVTNDERGSPVSRGWGFPALHETDDELNFGGNSRGYLPEVEFILSDLITNAFSGGGGSSVTGTGLWHSRAGVLDAAASIGTADQLMGTNHAGDDTVWFTPSGDVSLLSGAFTVEKIHGATVPSAGSLTTGNVLQVTGSSALGYGPVDLGAGSDHVVGILPAGNQYPQSLGGDLGGTTALGVVGRIFGATVPPAGSLVTGNLLQVSGSASLVYAALNLGGGSGYVTGLLPAGNQSPQSLSGDASGTTAAVVVDHLHGATVPTGTSLTVGNGLYASGAGALAYSALNLAGGAGWVTGLLPLANLGAPTGTGLAKVSGAAWVSSASKLAAADVTGTATDGFVVELVAGVPTWTSLPASVTIPTIRKSVLAGTSSTQSNNTNPRVLGSFYWDPAVNYGQTSTGTVVLHVIVETSLASNGVYVDMYKFTGTGSPAVLGTTTVSTTTTATHVTLDLTSVFKVGGTAVAGIYQVRMYLSTNDGSTFATCTGAWLEITP